MVEQEVNRLFPIFLQLEKLSLLVVGGGNVALEKLKAVWQNAPDTAIRLVANRIDDGLRQAARSYRRVSLVRKSYDASDLEGVDLVIVAVEDRILGQRIRQDTRGSGKLINVADMPELCDFYLGSIVRKGHLKIAISTNGKSPTIAKRLRETLSEALPDGLDTILIRMHEIRRRLKGDFDRKVKVLNTLTSDWSSSVALGSGWRRGYWKKFFFHTLLAIFLMLIGHVLFSYTPLRGIWQTTVAGIYHLDSNFYQIILTGFLAQLVDGAIGMGYGVTCTTVLLSLGIPLPSISAGIHTAEIFSSGVSGYNHYKLGNVNKKLFRALLIPGVLGAALGALLLSRFGEVYSDYLKPLLAIYTLSLGIKILLSAWRRSSRKRVKNVGWLAALGGVLDTFGGGGWGPMVTGTLISRGRTPRYVIGSVNLTEFFVTLAGALTFFSTLGLSYWQIVLGLVFGGTLSAPLATRLSGKLPVKAMFYSVGGMVVFWSLRILWKTLELFF
ncbi:MAG: TSUP family transporter [Flavobacteriales bacterium Tduv]